MANKDFLRQLQAVAEERFIAWSNGGESNLLFKATELGGEVGELLNVTKKLCREQQGWRGSRATIQDFEDECGDVLICLAHLANHFGIDLVKAVTKKFNETSDKVGLPHKLEVEKTDFQKQQEGFPYG